MPDDEGRSIEVNFSAPFPLFPLDGVVLLPHALLRLYIFEPRYRQMVRDALDGQRMIAMAVFMGDDWADKYHGTPALQSCVCIGHIVHHEREPSGNYRIVLQGVCRARIKREQPAGSPEERLYRAAALEPIELQEPAEDDLLAIRDEMLTELRSEPMTDLASVGALLRELQQREISTPALMEVVTLSVLNEKKLQYRLLAEADATRRGGLICRELEKLRHSLEFASRQHDPEAPPGVTWN